MKSGLKPGLHEWEFDKDGGAFLVGVLDFGLGQSGLGAVGPLDGLLRLIDRAIFDELGEDAQDAGFVAGVHRQVRALPITKDAEAAEGTALDVDEFERKLGAAAADFGRLEARGFLDDLELDRQAVAVPAGDKRHGVAGHGLGFDDQILEQFIERGAHVDVAIGEGRAVVENEFRRLGRAAAGEDFLVEPVGFPAREAGGFVLHQISPHRESRLRESQRVFVIRCGAHERNADASNRARWGQPSGMKEDPSDRADRLLPTTARTCIPSRRESSI